MLDGKWNLERPLLFDHVFLTKTLGSRKTREIWAMIDHVIDLWERGIQAGLVGDVLAEGRDREGCVKRRVEEDEDRLAHSFHITLLPGKLWQAVCLYTDR